MVHEGNPPEAHDGHREAGTPRAPGPSVRLRRIRRLPVPIADIEAQLGLAPGAWRERGLFALRLQSEQNPTLGLARGSCLIAEPVAAHQPGARAALPGSEQSPQPALEMDRLVVLRDAEGLMLGRLESGEDGRSFVAAPDPTVLPFPIQAGRDALIGTVIATLTDGQARPRDCTYADELEDAGGAGGSRDTYRNGCASANDQGQQQLFAPDGAGADPATRLQRDLAAWQGWAESRERSSATLPREHWRGLARHLATLQACIEIASDRRLSGALLSEAERVVRTLARRARKQQKQHDGEARQGRVAANPRQRSDDTGSAPRHEEEVVHKTTHTGEPRSA